MSITIKIPLKGQYRDLVCFEEGSGILNVDDSMDLGLYGERDILEWMELAHEDSEDFRK
jgi:hypothetical protein